MAMRHFGVEGYRAMIEHDVAMARRLAELVRGDPDFVLWEPQGLSIVCFRAAPAALADDPAALDALNRTILQRVQLGGEAFLSSTVLDGRFWLRACIVNPRATPDDVARTFAAVRGELRRALDDASAPRP